MDKERLPDVAQVEINIGNINSNSQIVLNDLRLLELLHKYPFLFSKALAPQADKDYEEWGWSEIAKAFNQGYEGLRLSAPFSVEELQWRWNLLRPICASLAKASHQLPDSLSQTIAKINQLIACKPISNGKPCSAAKKFMLNQVSFVEQLTEEQQRRLEVEVLDAIFNAERSKCIVHELHPEEEDKAQNEYNAFLKKIRLRELPAKSRTTNQSFRNNIWCGKRNEYSTPIIVNNVESSLDISSVRCMQSLGNEHVPEMEIEAQLEIKAESLEPQQAVDHQRDKVDLQLRYVPLKSVKQYVKRVRVRLKRSNLDDYLPLASLRKSRKRSTRSSTAYCL